MLEITMKTNESITFEEGCNLYLQNCRERNLREDTIRHYRQSYLRFYKHFDRDMPISERFAAMWILSCGRPAFCFRQDMWIAEQILESKCAWIW